MVYRREMMPLLSLIFSALFILFGTVVIQAFRSENLFFAHISQCIAFDKIKRYKCCVIAVTPVRIIRLKQKLKMGQGLKMGPRELGVLQGKKA